MLYVVGLLLLLALGVCLREKGHGVLDPGVAERVLSDVFLLGGGGVCVCMGQCVS